MDLPRYCLVGVRPVKLVRTDDGGMACLEFDPETDRFEPSLDVLERVMFPTEPDVDGGSSSGGRGSVPGSGSASSWLWGSMPSGRGTPPTTDAVRGGTPGLHT